MLSEDNNKLRLEKISLYDDTEIKKWDDFVESHPCGTPYHLSCWLKTIHQTYSYKPYLYILRNNYREIYGIFPYFLIKSLFTGTRIVSLPFSDYGGPLYKQNINKKEILSRIIKEYGSSVKYIEIRNDLNDDTDFICHNYYKHYVLDLHANQPEIKSIRNKRTIQYSIRKAEREGVEIKEENNQYGINEFYRLNILTRKKHGVPSQPKRFFENLYKNIISKGHGFILLAVYNSGITASSIFLTFANQIHYKYNASDTKLLKKISPNHLLIWYAVQRGIKENYQLFDLGRTSPDNKGLMRFKNMWGNKCIDLPYYYYPKVIGSVTKKESGLYYSFITRLWRSLPDLVQNTIGPLFYRHLG